ncbi:LacI family transcriptional regulator [Mesorhizobium sp. 113-1-2]|jgi:LacI family transcriptional regulator|uniref:LacI family DNA-binding transcriptional regulator n=1 Tax=Mesorhizobium sp. 113-1-2 TaxID=2744515 RepID=UPI0008198F7D|nr:LacI family DNA-binding transcriptional regulator [Mesorhizobium sp. 113-1-2]BAV52194.1 Transcription regulator [Mesorhizobium loti]BCG74137.1 LacI family transcriptional regulator [Mesorhizobium sp. 113-1-2]
MAKAAATISDVARRARVSTSTVSHVINGTRLVSPEKTALVNEAIAATGYQPNALARSLARKVSNYVGIAISAITNPYFSDIICAIENECARLGLLVFLADTRDEPGHELAVVQALQERRVDGIILAPCGDPENATVRYLERSGIPTVLVDRFAESAFDHVGVENKQAVANLVSHIAGLGHRRIGMLGAQAGFSTTRERIEGYRLGLKRNGIGFDADLVQPSNMNFEATQNAVAALLKLANPPTAIITGNNLTTIGAVAAIRKAGLRIPQDISLAGFDDFEWADYFEPRLTLIAQPCNEIGHRAAQMLVERINGLTAAPRSVRLKSTLVVRDSCAAPAAS